MPLTVITIKNVPQSLRGDLTKWMQEIATGVYVGNFNVKVRENLWNRVKDSVKCGEATISFSYRNEIGYNFDTINAQREVKDFDGIPLIFLPNEKNDKENSCKLGFSNVAKYRRIKKYSHNLNKKKQKSYVVVDIETDGLNEYENSIIEIGAIKVENSNIYEFNHLIKIPKTLSKNIINLTGITQELINNEGKSMDIVLNEFLKFIGNLDIVGYNVDFDIRFINSELKKLGIEKLKNNVYDLMKYVKNEKLFLDNYKLQTVLQVYGIDEKIPHRALLDSKIIYKLSTKVNKFLINLNKE